MKFYICGGYNRDKILGGYSSKDIDYSVLAESYESLGESLERKGYQIVHTYADKMTYRAKNPDSGEYHDFVWARTNEVYVDGDLVSASPGTLQDDMSRRDFTVNAIAKDPDSGEYIDYFGGVQDCKDRILRCVGDPVDRFREDPRRILRGIRFMVTRNLTPDGSVSSAFNRESVVSLLVKDKYKDSIVAELNKSFKYDTPRTLEVIYLYPEIRHVLFSKSGHFLYLEVESKKRKNDDY